MEQIREKINEIADNLTRMGDKLDNALTRLTVLETKNGNRVEQLVIDSHAADLRLVKLEQTQQTHSYNWGRLFDGMLKVTWTVLAAIVLYKLGMKP